MIAIPNSSLFTAMDVNAPERAEILYILDGSDVGTAIPITQVLSQGGTAQEPAYYDFILSTPLPAGTFDFSIANSYHDFNVTNNQIDTTGTLSEGLDLASNFFGVVVKGNTFTGDQSATTTNDAHSTGVAVVNDAEQPNTNVLGSFNSEYVTRTPMFGIEIEQNTFNDPLTAVEIYDYHDTTVPTAYGRTYTIVSLTDNTFVYTYANAHVIQTGDNRLDAPSNPVSVYSKLVPAPGTVTYDPNASFFLDPRVYYVTTSGNTIQWKGVTNPPSGVEIRTVDLNNTLYNGLDYRSDPSPSILTTVPVEGSAPNYTFDFGPDGQTLQVGATAVSNSTSYDATSLGYGWTSDAGATVFDLGPISGSNDMTRDGVSGTDLVFQVDVPNGWYEVTPTIGDLGSTAYQDAISLQGTQVDLVSTSAGQVVSPKYVTQVTDGHLILALLGVGSNQLAAIEGLAVLPLSFDMGPASQPVLSGDVPVETSTSYSTTQGYGWTPWPGTVGDFDRGAVAGSNQMTEDGIYASGMTFQVDLPNGRYNVSPTLGDLGNYAHSVAVSLQGNYLGTVPTAGDQVATPTYLVDVTNGQLSLQLDGEGSDGYAVIEGLSIAPAPAPYKFDFGPAVNDQAGYDAVSSDTYYSSSFGYGWLPITGTTGDQVRDGSTGATAMDQTLKYAPDMTFQVDLPNGNYEVMPTLGDVGNYAHTAEVFVQGTQVDTVSTAGGQVVTPSYEATVTNGSLTLRLVGTTANGSDGYAVIEGLEIAPVVTSIITIDAGGNAAGSYSADAYFSGGYTDTTTNTIDTSGVNGTVPEAVYQSERYANSFSYTIPGLVPDAGYSVRLDFAEYYYTSAGDREFDVSINGFTVLSHFDIFDGAGGENRAVAKTFTTTADSNGVISIQFTNFVGGAKVDGIAIAPSSDTTISIDAGGGSAGTYVADTSFTGGSEATTTTTVDTSGVVDPAPQAVYQSERFGNDFSYTVDGLTPNAPYTVRLDFAEFYYTGAGQREFNVAINGVTVLSDFDIYAAAGGQFKAVEESLAASADGSGVMTIEFINVVGGAKVDGISVSPDMLAFAADAGGTAAGYYSADADFNGGSAATYTGTVDTSGVVNPAPQAVYLTERFGNSFSYSVTGLSPNAAYIVRLDFAEMFYTAAGQREFNVAINGSTVLTDFDIFAAAGGEDKAVAVSLQVNADSSGVIAIGFTNVVGGAKVDGISVTLAPQNMTLMSSPASTLVAGASSPSGPAVGSLSGAPSAANGAASTSTPASGAIPSRSYLGWVLDDLASKREKSPLRSWRGWLGDD